MRITLILLLSLFCSLAHAQGTVSSTCIWSGTLADCLPSAGLILRDQRDLRLGEASTNGSDYVAIQAASSFTTYTLTMPPDDGDANEFLQTNGSGTLTWEPVDVATDITGVLPIANGGTNKALTLSAGSLIYSDADSFEVNTAGTSQDWALSGGTGAPTFSSVTTTSKTIVDASVVNLKLGTNQTNTTSKTGTVGTLHYTNSEEPMGLISGVAGSTTNSLRVGGGSSLFNAATDISLYTAANSTTTTGTIRLQIQDDGGVEITDTGGNGGNVVHGCTRRTNSCAAATTCTVSCSAGEIVLGGGCDTNGTLQSTYPSTTTAWSCNTIASATINISAICCDY